MESAETLIGTLSTVAGPGKVLFATLASIFGLVYFFLPNIPLDMRIWWTKQTLGADFIPSKRTVAMYRIFGGICITISALIFMGVF